MNDVSNIRLRTFAARTLDIARATCEHRPGRRAHCRAAPAGIDGYFAMRPLPDP